MSQSLRVSRIHWAVFLDSLLWRGLTFARSLQGKHPHVARRVRQAVLLLWWSATLQVHIHARYWLKARRLRRTVPEAAAAPALQQVDPQMLVLPCAEQPVVSIIVPCFGQTGFTLQCLASIAQYAPDVPMEVIVIDDAWAGSDNAALEAVRGIRLIRNESNLGYLRSCNKAAGQAQGRYVYFLNNDVRVLDNWLRPMLALLQDRPDVGAVGAKLLFPDGSLQEAGGIIWRDGSGWNFGRGGDPASPEFNYVREVDYCSGAALLVRAEAFRLLGGFDERYAPAYFEDSDLCFRLRRIGLKTLYQPASQVIHYEGISHGTDTATGAKSYQISNRKTFVDEWAPELTTRHYPNGQRVFRAKDRAHDQKIVLVVDHMVPTPDRDAGSRTMIAFLHVLLQAGLVVKFWPHNTSYSPGYTDVLQGMGVEVFYGPALPPFDDWIRQNGSEPDMVMLSRPDVAEDVIRSIRAHSKARVVYYGHDLHFWRMRQQASVKQDERLRWAADRMEEREFAIWRQVDLSLYPSDEEAQIASALQPDAAISAVVPYCFDRFGDYRPAPAAKEIVFVGGFAHPPNEDAACWLVNDILPLIRQRNPAAHLSIIGSNPSARVQALAGDGVTVTANVSDMDLEVAYARARVAVVPLRCGAGVKLKVVEALRAGVPLVTTPIGAQGLAGLFGVAAIEDDRYRFADAVLQLLDDDVEWEQRSRRQIAFARSRFSRDAMRETLLRAMGVPVTGAHCQPPPDMAG